MTFTERKREIERAGEGGGGRRRRETDYRRKEQTKRKG